MGKSIIECVPNFSEGRDLSVAAAIVEAIRTAKGVQVLAFESDADHNRSVVTFAGHPDAVVEGAFRGVKKAAERIDLNRHEGVHPRIGAADVVPLIPVRGISLEECAALAHDLGERVWNELGIPVYFYESAAKRPERRRLEVVRKGGFETLRNESRSPERSPDLGGPDLHATAGAVIVGARKFLLAYNINLTTSDVGIAKQIAMKIRASSGGLPCVKAMGVLLKSRGLAQVSMNLTDFEVTGLHTVFEAVRHEAQQRGVGIAGSEIIGLMPAQAMAAAAARFLQCENYQPETLFETRLLDTDLVD